MPLASGTRLGSYEVLDLLGEGGMGQVYRARDHKLNRDVALKVISPVVADDPDRLSRFRREAQVLASLNHPNIAQIYGFEDSPSTGSGQAAGPALVLELVEGPTLVDRIAAGPIPVTDTLAIARQIADALAVAHERGIVHRDLKPANIKIGDAGTVKILDFGLAKALTDPLSTDSGPSTLANSPTITARGTEIGVILGTAAYMSPEQARGKPVDRRADIWAFGVVLYEMLTGRRAFRGSEVSDVLASVLKDTPSLDALPADTPASVRRLLRRALEKDPARRLDSMSVARLELDDSHVSDLPGPSGVEGHDKPAPSRRVVIPVAIAAVLSGLAVAAGMWLTRPTPEAPSVVRLGLSPLPDQPIGIEANHNDLAISPDGRRIVYLSDNTQSRWFTVRSLDRADGLVLDKLVGSPRGMFISDDGRWIAYQAGSSLGRENELRKVPIDGGVSVGICALRTNMRGGSWAADDTIVFATVESGVGLLRVPAAGGTPEVLTRPVLADGELDHLWPHHLPDGRHVLFAIARVDGTWDVALLSLETKSWRVLVKDAFAPRYVSSGHLLYASGDGIRAVPFDLQTLETNGTPIEVVPDVLTKDSGAADYAVSANGTLVYLPGGTSDHAQTLAWREPDGRDTPIPAPALNYQTLRLSPDGQRAISIVSRRQGATGVLWLIDLARGTGIRLTPENHPVSAAIWHPDGQQIIFTTWSPAAPVESHGVFRIAVSGTGVPEKVRAEDANRVVIPSTWTPDRHLLLTYFLGQGSADIVRLDLASPSELTTVIGGPLVETYPSLSPNGRWLAYVEEENGLQVFVRPYPDVNKARIPASNGPGAVPNWSRDGRQLYFGAPNQELMVMDVDESRAGSIAFSKPRPVMSLRDELNDLMRIAMPPVNGRILRTIRAVASMERATEYRVVLNWLEELKTRVPTR